MSESNFNEMLNCFLFQLPQFQEEMGAQNSFNRASDSKLNQSENKLIPTEQIEMMGNNNLYGEDWWLPIPRNSDLDLFSWNFWEEDIRSDSATPAKVVKGCQMKIEEEQPDRKQELESQIEDNTRVKQKKRAKKSIKESMEDKLKSRSETKNIPKNYGKAIMILVRDNRELVEKVINHIGSPFTFEQINEHLQLKKNRMNKISDLRDLWLNCPYEKELRIITGHFLRKRSYYWTFNSRVEDRHTILKYRNKIIQGVRNPQEFKHLKMN